MTESAGHEVVLEVDGLVAADPPRCDVELNSLRGEGAVASINDRREAVGTSSLMEDEPGESDTADAIGTGTDVAAETADVVLMRTDLLQVMVTPRIGCASARIERQHRTWPIAYITLALLFAAGVFEPALGLVFRRGNAAITIAGSSALVAVNALTLTWLKLPRSAPADPAGASPGESSGASTGISAVTGRR